MYDRLEFNGCSSLFKLSVIHQVGMTGLLEIRGSVYTHMDQISDEEYGVLLAENTIGSRHDHFLTYHLDLDIDGEANSFVKSTLQMTSVDGLESPRRSYWKVISETAKTESDAKIRLGIDQAELLFVNPNKKTRVGNLIGYRLIPGSATVPLSPTTIMLKSVEHSPITTYG